MARRSPPSLSAEERQLWESVLRDVKPLKGAYRPMPAIRQAEAVRVDAPRLPDIPARPVSTSKPSVPPLANLETRLRRELHRGNRASDGVLDLHGLTQVQAHHRLVSFLHRQQALGSKVVLVITGKGSASENESFANQGRGILRRVVPQWLQSQDLRHLIVGYEEAGIRHGGEGALYIRLRRL